jgi:hypothetical protein
LAAFAVGAMLVVVVTPRLFLPPQTLVEADCLAIAHAHDLADRMITMTLLEGLDVLDTERLRVFRQWWMHFFFSSSSFFFLSCVNELVSS